MAKESGFFEIISSLDKLIFRAIKVSLWTIFLAYVLACGKNRKTLQSEAKSLSDYYHFIREFIIHVCAK